MVRPQRSDSQGEEPAGNSAIRSGPIEPIRAPQRRPATAPAGRRVRRPSVSAPRPTPRDARPSAVQDRLALTLGIGIIGRLRHDRIERPAAHRLVNSIARSSTWVATTAPVRFPKIHSHGGLGRDRVPALVRHLSLSELFGVVPSVLSAIQFCNAESPAVGSLRRRCEIFRFGKPQTVPGGLAGALYSTPSAWGYRSRRRLGVLYGELVRPALCANSDSGTV